MADDVGPKSLDLRFIEVDIRNQLARSREILSQVRELRRVASGIDDNRIKAEIHESLTRLLDIADSLASNALATTASLETIINPTTEQQSRWVH
jgi:hypothetical protein